MEKKYKPIEINDDSIKRKINAIRNEKLKLGLRLQIKSGLRVKEIAELQKEDITFNDDGTIRLHVKYGKREKKKNDSESKIKPRDVNVRPDKWLYDRLKKFVESSEDGNIFYSSHYIKHKAMEYGIQTHDLRRINAQERLNDLKKEGLERMKAKEEVGKELGHSDVKFTNIYLNRRRITSTKKGSARKRGRKK